jgi:hypothetical protein
MIRHPARVLAITGLCLAISVSFASRAPAIDKCTAGLNRASGVLRVKAMGVDGPLRWGFNGEAIEHEFFNASTCVSNDVAAGCVIADPASVVAKTPPADCEIVIQDQDGEPCRSWIRGCIPGPRNDEIADLQSKTACMAASAQGDVVFEGCNVLVRSGQGATDGEPNGKGNVIVGYDEDYGGAPNRSGSHNVVIGPGHSYSSYGGLVAGSGNNASGPHASVIAGSANEAAGSGAFVGGGHLNVASGDFSSVTGGRSNEASGTESSVLGGEDNEAAADFAVVVGGAGNLADAPAAVVSGGFENVASGASANAVGGRSNTASGITSVVLGGNGNTVSADDAIGP